MTKLSIANKNFEIEVKSISDEEIKIKLKTSDTSYFKHDLDIIDKNDKMLLAVYLRNYAYSLKLDNVIHEFFYPVNLRKSRDRGFRILTLKKYHKPGVNV